MSVERRGITDSRWKFFFLAGERWLHSWRWSWPHSLTAQVDSKIFRVQIGGGLHHIFSHFPEIWANFPKKFANSLKSSKIGITPVKTTEILRNSEKNRRKFDENLQNLPSLSKINKNFAEFCKNSAKVLKNHRNLEWCKGKNVDLVKSFPTSIYLQNLASIQPRTSPRKVPKNASSKGPRWW